VPRQTWVETVAWATADGTAIANTTTETIIFPNITIPANYLADGRILRLTLYGRYSTTGTPTMTFRARWGGSAGTVIAASGAMVGGSAVTNAMWKMELMIQVRSNGSSGSVFATGSARLGAAATSTVGSATSSAADDLMGSAGVATPAAVTVDLTADTALSVTGTWGTASASNTLTGHNYTLEAMN
jgi:hypothetical protein